MKIKEILNNYINESASGKDMDKLVSFMNRVYNGNISQQGMMAAGFNMRNPVANSESKLAESLGVRLSINITEDDVRNALRELRIKNASGLVARWNDVQGRKQQRTDDASLEGSKGQKRF